MSFFLLHCKLVEELSVPPERLMTLWPWWVNSSEETNIGIWCILKRKRYYTFWNPSRYILGIKKCLTWLRRSLWSHLFKLFVSSHRFWSDLLLRRQTWKTAWPHSHQRVVETLLSKTGDIYFLRDATGRRLIHRNRGLNIHDMPQRFVPLQLRWRLTWSWCPEHKVGLWSIS